MLNDIVLYSYNSEVKKINPITKLVCLFIFIILNVIYNDLFSIVLFILCLFLMVNLFHIPFKVIGKKVLLLLSLFVILLFFNYILAFKFLFIFLFISIINLTTNFKDLLYVFSKIFINKRIALYFTCCFKYFSYVLKSFDDIINDYKCSSIRFKSCKNKFLLVVNIILSSFIDSKNYLKRIINYSQVNFYVKNKNLQKFLFSSSDFYLLFLFLILFLILILRGCL